MSFGSWRTLSQLLIVTARASGQIRFFSAQQNLRALDCGPTVNESQIKYGFLVAVVAGAFDFLDGIRDFEQTLGAFKQMCLEVATETVANHRNFQIPRDGLQMFHNIAT